MATGLETTNPEVLEIPSRFVCENDCTWAAPVALKNEGKPVMEKAGVAAAEVVAVKRVHRSATVSTVEEAIVVPCAAVNAVT